LWRSQSFCGSWLVTSPCLGVSLVSRAASIPTSVHCRLSGSRPIRLSGPSPSHLACSRLSDYYQNNAVRLRSASRRLRHRVQIREAAYSSTDRSLNLRLRSTKRQDLNETNRQWRVQSASRLASLAAPNLGTARTPLVRTVSTRTWVAHPFPSTPRRSLFKSDLGSTISGGISLPGNTKYVFLTPCITG
jgi:hypothetical protein